jgi:hypothetical protein
MLDDFLLGNYKTVSERLGLTIEGGVTQGYCRIYGVVDGVPLHMWFGPHATHTGALLSTTAPIELGVAQTSLLGKLGHLFGAHPATLGDPEFDRAFSVKAQDLARLSQLLDGDARRVLLELAHEGLHPALDAHSVHLRRFSQGGLDGEAGIERQVRETARLAKAVGASFARAG